MFSFRMKKLFIFLFALVLLSSCANMLATSTGVAEKSTSTIRTADQIRFDIQIKKNIKELVNRETIPDIEYCNFNVIDGSVLAVCVVANEIAKKNILEKISTIKEIVEVFDEIIVDPMINKHYFRDFWLKRAIESKIFVKTSIKSINYDLTIINGNVYIIGIARDQRELESVTKSIATINGVKEVNSYIVLLSNSNRIFNKDL